MRVVAIVGNQGAVRSFYRLSERLSQKRFEEELHRGVVDAGRRTKTAVQKAVKVQMNLREGNYQSYVVAGTRGVPRRQILAFDIFGVKGGTHVEEYRGLRSVRRGSRLNAGRTAIDRGTVRSAVWNNPRVFKRSFEGTKGGYFAMLPPSSGTSSRAPKALWTFGRKPNQPRIAGRFASPGVQYGKVRRLFGPSLLKEIPQDESLATFYRQANFHLEVEVSKRLTKLMRF